MPKNRPSKNRDELLVKVQKLHRTWLQYDPDNVVQMHRFARTLLQWAKLAGDQKSYNHATILLNCQNVGELAGKLPGDTPVTIDGHTIVGSLASYC